MVSAWLMDNDSGDQRLEHHRSPPVFVSLDDLSKTAGVEYFKVNLESLDTELEDIKRKRGYSYEDEINISRDHLPNYEEKLKIFFQEHLHTDEEIRLVLEGSGYFDVRDHEENWVRILVTPGDLLILPAGIYHRFTLDTNNFIRAKRYFVGEPVWTPHNRPCDEMECRKNYLESMKKKMEE
ncbi:1,2-dihydroxy-3-keto-5-methylthiopentene dioxygenase isoform X1 [Ischnura elegans]|uniref:1,2-dihydroxy-3-keto-5-methylthiopentene dioxygenase isoform X1 n=1 Tax=Ischnura elegans TaxID=197161 RepID=UPI001ED8BE4D|nr:1,2-dihydroxy-3-keto-5-methylthiopentene dioxygenase isoform X1 [Ischnura elegans]